jgi:hypothetical protein
MIELTLNSPRTDFDCSCPLNKIFLKSEIKKIIVDIPAKIAAKSKT